MEKWNNRSEHLLIGSFGEDIACDYLLNNGYQILCRNFREKFGEIDIVAKESNGIVIFFEVKTMLKSSNLIPEDNFTKFKFMKFSKTCQMFVAKHPMLFDEKRGWQINLITVVVPAMGTLTYTLKDCVISVYENISL